MSCCYGRVWVNGLQALSPVFDRLSALVSFYSYEAKSLAKAKLLAL